MILVAAVVALTVALLGSLGLLVRERRASATLRVHSSERDALLADAKKREANESADAEKEARQKKEEKTASAKHARETADLRKQLEDLRKETASLKAAESTRANELALKQDKAKSVQAELSSLRAAKAEAEKTNTSLRARIEELLAAASVSQESDRAAKEAEESSLRKELQQLRQQLASEKEAASNAAAAVKADVAKAVAAAVAEAEAKSEAALREAKEEVTAAKKEAENLTKQLASKESSERDAADAKTDEVSALAQRCDELEELLLEAKEQAVAERENAEEVSQLLEDANAALDGAEQEARDAFAAQVEELKAKHEEESEKLRIEATASAEALEQTSEELVIMQEAYFRLQAEKTCVSEELEELRASGEDVGLFVTRDGSSSPIERALSPGFDGSRSPRLSRTEQEEEYNILLQKCQLEIQEKQAAMTKWKTQARQLEAELEDARLELSKQRTQHAFDVKRLSRNIGVMRASTESHLVRRRSISTTSQHQAKDTSLKNLSASPVTLRRAASEFAAMAASDAAKVEEAGEKEPLKATDETKADGETRGEEVEAADEATTLPPFRRSRAVSELPQRVSFVKPTPVRAVDDTAVAKKALSESAGLARLDSMANVSMQKLFQSEEMKEELRKKKEKMSAKRTNLAKEVLQTEQHFVDSLSRVCDGLIRPLEAAIKDNKPILTASEMKAVFGCIEVIKNYNSVFLEQLTARLAEWQESDCIGDLFLNVVQWLQTYSAYINNYDTALSTLSEVSKRDEFKKFMKTPGARAACGKEDLPSLLIAPIQRIPRYVLLVQNLKNNTFHDHADYEDVCAALDKMKTAADMVDAAKKRYDNIHKVFQVVERFGGNVSIVEPHRVYISEARFYRAAKYLGQGDHEIPTKDVFILLLFSDIVIVARPKTQPPAPPPEPLSPRRSARRRPVSARLVEDVQCDLEFRTMIPIQHVELSNIDNADGGTEQPFGMKFASSEWTKKLYAKTINSKQMFMNETVVAKTQHEKLANSREEANRNDSTKRRISLRMPYSLLRPSS